jgi:hypothetical protein
MPRDPDAQSDARPDAHALVILTLVALFGFGLAPPLAAAVPLLALAVLTRS